jgi:sRNA-binding protein
MANDKEMSDLSVSRAECPKCGAVWINGQHYWSGTGKKGNELDLAGLVCNKLGNHQCINPRRGADGGDTWAKRLSELEENGPEMDKDMRDK